MHKATCEASQAPGGGGEKVSNYLYKYPSSVSNLTGYSTQSLHSDHGPPHTPFPVFAGMT